MAGASSALIGSVAKKANIIKTVVSFSEFRYGHDPSHYPIKALPYVFSHPTLLKRIFCVAFVGISLAFAALILLLIFALKPQAMGMGGGKWWSWVLAVMAVLLEAALISALLIAGAQSKAQTEVFTETMKLENCWDEERMKRQSLFKDFQFLKKNFFVRIITYPLNLIPFLGAGLYSAINATFIGWDYMDRYFDAIKLPGNLQRMEVLGEDRSDLSALFSRKTYDDDNEYARFGFIVAFFETIPIVGAVFFPLTNACGAALFACDIERAGGPSVRPYAEEGVTTAPNSPDHTTLPYKTDTPPNSNITSKLWSGLKTLTVASTANAASDTQESFESEAPDQTHSKIKNNNKHESPSDTASGKNKSKKQQIAEKIGQKMMKEAGKVLEKEIDKRLSGKK